MTGPDITDVVVLLFVWAHGWFARLTFVAFLALALRLAYLYGGHRDLRTVDRVLVVASQVLLVLVVLSGGYMSGPLNVSARAAHHLLGLAPLITTGVYVGLVAIRHFPLPRERSRRLAMSLVITNLVLIFLAYWISWGAAFGWWPRPDAFPWEFGRTGL